MGREQDKSAKKSLQGPPFSRIGIRGSTLAKRLRDHIFLSGIWGSDGDSSNGFEILVGDLAGMVGALTLLRETIGILSWGCLLVLMDSLHSLRQYEVIWCCVGYLCCHSCQIDSDDGSEREYFHIKY